MRNKCYDLYELRQLTESILITGQRMSCYKNDSMEYKIMSAQYEELWKRRDEIEERIVGLCNKNNENDYWVI